MKTRAEMQKLLGCKYHEAKKISDHCGWKVVRKRGYVFYDVTDKQIESYIANPIVKNDIDFTIEVWKLVFGWSCQPSNRIRYCP